MKKCLATHRLNEGEKGKEPTRTGKADDSVGKADDSVERRDGKK